MSGIKRYLLDSDVLVTSNRWHYQPGFCEAFWDWIDAGHKSGRFYSIDKVKDELCGPKKEPDLLHKWAMRPGLADFFLKSSPAATHWSDLSNWALARPYLPAAKEKFLNVKSADAWLIAFSLHAGECVVVTNEVAAPESKRDIKLPDAATAHGVQTMNLSALLALHAHKNFTFKA